MYEKARQFTLTHPRLRKVVGVFLVLIGLFALVTPLTPGALLFLFVGFEFLGLHFLFIEKMKRRYLRGK
jgi:uncharacterized membrane protein HdeD (DUF308 family)